MFKNYLTKFNNACTSLYFDVLDYLEGRAAKRKHKKEVKRKAKEQAAYDEACSYFNFIVNPFETPERYVILEGEFFHVTFNHEGVSILDVNNHYIENKLTRLKVLNQLRI